jgi:putative FmdB family regulatory protein
MPTYEYECPRCGVMDVFQSMRDPVLTECPTCHAKGLRKLVSAGAGVIFSGSGFWETDYNRSKDYASKAKGETAKPAEAKPAEAKPTATAPAATTKPTTPS